MSVRPPAVAGMFYDARPDRLATRRRPAHLAAAARRRRRAGLRRDRPARRLRLLGPRRRRRVRAARDPADRRHPLPEPHGPRRAGRARSLGRVAHPARRRAGRPRASAERLLELAPSLEPDAAAHAREHSLEVQLPFLQVLRPDVAIVPICLGAPRPRALPGGRRGARRARARRRPSRPLLLASSDMNHYESRAVGRAQGRPGARAHRGDRPRGPLPRRSSTESISMCGFLPATALLFAARAAGRGAGPRRRAARQRRRDRRHVERGRLRGSDRGLRAV